MASSTHLPKPRGPLSEDVMAALLGDRAMPVLDREQGVEGLPGIDPEDAALTLWTLYELSYRGYAEVDDSWEWHPDAVALRHVLEVDLETRLRARFPGVPDYDRAGGTTAFAEALFSSIESHDGPSLSRYVQRKATADQVLELIQLRSLYHLKESDPVAFSVPRMPARSRAALMELQYDEYGGGRPDRLHAHLFAQGMTALGLDATEGFYVGQAPLEVLEENNAMSLFGLHRRLRGASVGHLAAFEATSSIPCRRMSQGLERLGLAPEMRVYYDEHVEADAVHEQLAARLICGRLIEDEPETEADVWFGAFTCLDTEARVATHLLDRWGVSDD